MSTYSDSDEEWQLEGGLEASHEPAHPGFQGGSDHLQPATNPEAPALTTQDDARSTASTAFDLDLGEDFENVSTEDLDQQIQQLRLQNEQINVDDDSSSAAGRLSRQSMELQLQNLRAQNQALQRELLDLPPQTPGPQSSPSHTPAPTSPAFVDHNPFNPTSSVMQRTTSPPPAPTSQASASSSQTATRSPSTTASSAPSFLFGYPSPAVQPTGHSQPAQTGRSSPLVRPASPAALQPAGFGIGSSMGTAERSCSISSGPASPRSTLNGPSAHGSPAEHPAKVAAAPHGLGSSLAGAGRRSPAPSSGASSSSAETDRIMAAVAQRRKDAEAALIRLQAEQGGLEVQREEAARATQRMERILKGLDLAFLFDVTGSMEPWIRQAATKAKQIMDIANQIHPQAVMRMAFVGYRDYGDVQRFEIMDFVEKEGFPGLQRFLDHIVAKGGDDSTEDIAGGLKAITELSWRSSTRLVIHFGDYPCHGKKYHGQDWEQYDRYPVGDPEGLIPENYLEWLAGKRTDYYFAQLTPHTAMMANIFQESFANAANATFHKMDLNKGPEEFMPKVIDSIRSSMAKSSVFGPAAAHPAAEDRSMPHAAPVTETSFAGLPSLGAPRRRAPRTARNLGTD